MNLEALALARAQEQIASGTWRIEDAPTPKRPSSPVKCSRRRCRRCHVRKLRSDNRSNLCRFCAPQVTPRQLEAYRTGALPPRKGRLSPVEQVRRDVERAKAALKAKGIHVEAA